MATAQTLINQAFQRIGVIDPGEGPSADESNDALVTLNQLIESWSAQLGIYELKREDITLTGAQSYTLSPRPMKIKAAAVVLTGTMNLPILVVDAAGWNDYVDKQTASDFARVIWYEEGHPTGTLHLAPKPTGGTLEITSMKNVGEAQIKIRDTLTLTGPAFYTIGNGATLDTQLPISLTGASMSATGVVSQKANIISAEQWSEFRDKGIAGAFIDVIWYDGDFVTPKIYVAPKPASGTLELITQQTLPTLANLATTSNYPPGYDRAMVANLAVELAPDYGASAERVAGLANTAKSSIDGLNLANYGPPTITGAPPPAVAAPAA